MSTYYEVRFPVIFNMNTVIHTYSMFNITIDTVNSVHR